MKRESVLEILKNYRAQMSEHDVKSLSLFGSVARNEAGPESDVDILVEFNEPATFDNYIELKFFLEEVLGCTTDLVTPKAVRPAMWPQIEEEAIQVA